MNSIGLFILDDNPVFLNLLKIAIEEHFTFFATSDTEEFIEKVEQPAVLIVDMFLKNETGIEVMRRIKPKQKLFHVIFISATASKEIVLHAYNEHWGGSFLEKDDPNFWEDLIKRIREGREILRDIVGVVEQAYEISKNIEDSVKRLQK